MKSVRLAFFAGACGVAAALVIGAFGSSASAGESQPGPLPGPSLSAVPDAITIIPAPPKDLHCVDRLPNKWTPCR